MCSCASCRAANSLPTSMAATRTSMVPTTTMTGMSAIVAPPSLQLPPARRRRNRPYRTKEIVMKGILLMKEGFTGSLLLSTLLILAGCSLAPKYEVPSTPTIATFKEAPQQPLSPEDAGTWKTAQPSEDLARGEWWKVFEETKLNDLEQQALDANQNLKAAAARVKEARAMNQAARAGLFPSLDAGFGPTRERVSASSLFEPDGANVPQQTFWRAQASASYEVDLFGRVASTADAARADTQP